MARELVSTKPVGAASVRTHSSDSEEKSVAMGTPDSVCQGNVLDHAGVSTVAVVLLPVWIAMPRKASMD
jgi:hypothetical protein